MNSESPKWLEGAWFALDVNVTGLSASAAGCIIGAIVMREMYCKRLKVQSFWIYLKFICV
jgi:hypothetical protein